MSCNPYRPCQCPVLLLRASARHRHPLAPQCRAAPILRPTALPIVSRAPILATTLRSYLAARAGQGADNHSSHPPFRLKSS
jgi:hypothetical protein